MEIILSPKALKDLNLWKKSGNTGILKKIRALLESIDESPFEGIGQPEALKYNLKGLWSRRINKEHRMIYEVRGTELEIFSLFGHY